MMRTVRWHRRLLPLTIAVMLLLFTEKAAYLARAATGTAEIPASPGAPIATSAPIATDARLAAKGQPATSSQQAAGPMASVATPAELRLLADLRKRREALDDRARGLDQRADLLAATEQKLRVKLDELAALQSRLEAVEQARHKREGANWSGLVKTYEDMKPRDAAPIFNVLDLDVLLEVMDRMDERKAAAVLAAMVPERARQVTQMLARKRVRQDVVTSSPDQTVPDTTGHS